jgi:hypothetical protein
MPIITYGGLNNYFAGASHTYSSGENEDVVTTRLLENNIQDEYMLPIINQIKSKSTSSDEQVKIAISMVQHIPYDRASYISKSNGWYYPYETLYRNTGMCGDKSILLAYVLNELEYDVVLFEFSTHMTVGIKSDNAYDYRDTGYAFIEATSPNIITYVSDTYEGGVRLTEYPHIIHLKGGTRSLDVSQEYRDAIELKSLEGKTLNSNLYHKWETITNKYDTQYNTG